MQEAKMPAISSKTVDTRTKIEIFTLRLAFMIPLLLILGTFHWTHLPVGGLLIIVAMVAAIVVGIVRVSKQLVMAVKEGADTDYRER